MEEITASIHNFIAQKKEIIKKLEQIKGNAHHECIDLLIESEAELQSLIAQSIYTRYGNKSKASYLVAKEYNWTVPYSGMVLRAGEGLKHKQLGPQLKRYRMSVPEAATVVTRAKGLITGQPKLSTTARLMREGNFENKQHMNVSIGATVKRRNAEYKEKNNLTENLKTKLIVRNGHKGYKNLVLQNIGEHDNEIILDLIKNYVGDIGDQYKKSTRSEKHGAAAIKMLQDRSKSAHHSGRITTIFHVHQDEMSKENVQIFDSKGKLLDAETLAEIKAQWGESRDGNYMSVHDNQGRVVHLSQLRLANKAQRIILSAEQGGCVFPYCNNTQCQAHHIIPAKDGGATDTNNMVLLCERHHKIVDQNPQGLTLDRQTGISSFTDKNGMRSTGAGYHPHTAYMRKLGKDYGLDTTNEKEWRMLIWKLIKKNNLTIISRSA